MQLSMVVVGCLLVGRAPGDAPLPPTVEQQPALLQPIAVPEPKPIQRGEAETDPAAQAKEEGLKTEWDTPPAEIPPAGVPSARPLPTPPELVAKALVPRSESPLKGRPLTLLAALSSSADRRHQLEVTHAYWRLVEAVAVYHFNLDHDQQLQGLRRGRGFEAGVQRSGLLRTARAASAASVRETEVAAVAAQHELAALLLLSPDAPLPLPADQPHVGAYRTHFDRLFPLHNAPGRTRLIDRTLPILRRALEARASAALAAEDALAAAVDAHQSGRGNLPDLLACIQEHLRQRRALIRSVCLYNHEIADYALAVVKPGSNPEALVGMLINPSSQRAGPPVSGSGAGVKPTGFNQRVPTPARRPGQKVPTPAAPRALPGTLQKQVPTPATRWSAAPPPGKGQPTPAKRRNETQRPQAAPPEKSPLPVDTQPAEPTYSKVNKPITDVASEFRPPALYPALVDSPPDVQARQLTLTLHWDRTLPDGIGQQISLADCLGKHSGGDRRGLIEAYWLLRQRAAEYQVLVEQAELLHGLGLAARRDRRTSGLRLRAAGLDSEAALHEAHAALLEAQFELATRLGRASGAAWPMANTSPRWKVYLPKLDTQPRRLAESWPLRRLAAIIPGLAESVQKRATAVVEADAARADATSSQAGGRSIDPLPALASINRQTEQTFAFLATLTDYNRAIAEYALAVLPPETPGDELAEVLVAVQ